MNVKTEEKVVFWSFLAPILAAFALVVIIPFFIGIYYSFTDWNAVPGTETSIVGFANFIQMFRDGDFFRSIGTTAVYTVYAVILINIIGFALALLVTRSLKTANFMRTVFFMPNLIGGLILGFIWRFIFLKISPALFDLMGSQGIDWLGNANNALFAMAIVSTWQMGGYIMIIYIAAIIGIPSSLLEASELDGVSSLQKVRHIIFPMVAPAFTASLFLTLANSFKVFDVNYSLTQGAPAGRTELMAMNIYTTAYTRLDFGAGQAKAILFFILVALVTLTQVRYTKRREVEL